MDPPAGVCIISGTHFIQKFKAYGRSFHGSCVAAFLVYCCHHVWRRREISICPCFAFSSSEEEPMWQVKQICFTVTSSWEKPMTDRWNTGRLFIWPSQVQYQNEERLTSSLRWRILWKSSSGWLPGIFSFWYCRGGGELRKSLFHCQQQCPDCILQSDDQKTLDCMITWASHTVQMKIHR